MKIEMLILGEAGSGKSFLCDWLLAHCPAKSVTVVDGERVETINNLMYPVPFDLTIISVQTTTVEDA
jgi:ABC-type dipeptide/oligopeptide/nickel transport system ATPase component